jgi:hypothetical protein
MTITISFEPEAVSIGENLGDDSGPAPDESMATGSAMSVDLDGPPPEDESVETISGAETAADVSGPDPSDSEAAAGEGDAEAAASAPPPRDLDDLGDGGGDAVEAGADPPPPDALSEVDV